MSKITQKRCFLKRSKKDQKTRKNVKKGQKWPKSKNHEGGIMVPPKSSFFVKITFGKNPKKSENRPKIALFSGSQNPQKSTFFGPLFLMSTLSIRFFDVIMLLIRIFSSLLLLIHQKICTKKCIFCYFLRSSKMGPFSTLSGLRGLTT